MLIKMTSELLSAHGPQQLSTEALWVEKACYFSCLWVSKPRKPLEKQFSYSSSMTLFGLGESSFYNCVEMLAPSSVLFSFGDFGVAALGIKPGDLCLLSKGSAL